ncbi:LysR family transcriptional regulator [Ideonella livida]|uniref:LysR family transcriptional regulator n=1 Tax=Ideonella livida TaxID=2707176 RepID=A0A7C9PJD9_9BURK|nr:LysR family transcriptional regulator [Ideonella livida]NDY92530.1 LysR family transcriptional regulator [Ideonella livida]
MSNFDHLDLDGHALRLLLAVQEEGSITRAAHRLGVTQSAVSHGLDKLRAIVGDPLFVKSGRGIVATAQAELLARRARTLLEDLRAFSLAAGFEPARLTAQFTVAANDLQRDLLLPALLRRLRAQAPQVSLRIIPSGAPRPELLREGGCDLVITPRPPEAGDLVQKRLFTDRYAVFYDPACRTAPESAEAYLAAEHVTVVYEPRRALDVDQWLAAQGVSRRFVATVPGLGGLGALLRGGDWLATAPSLMARGALRDLAHAPVPVPTPPMPMYAVWHQRHHSDPVHQWLRAQLEAVVGPALVAD